MWVEVTPSEFPHERQGLDYVKKRLPEPEPYRAWSNFTFTDSRGGLNEVDLLVITPARMVLIELKGYPGLIEGDAGQWRWTSPKHTRPKPLDNPLHLANLKAKKLKSQLENTRAARAHKGRFPYLESAVFLHAENLTCKLSPDGRHHVFGLDEADYPHRPSTLDGLMAHLTKLDPRYGKQVDRPTSAMVAKAMEQAGIRRSAQARKVGHFTLGELLDEGEDWQDFKAAHPNLPDTHQRIRLYPLTKATSDEERAAFITSAKREVTLLQGVDHPAIDRPSDLVAAQSGPAVVFPYDPNATRLDHWLAEHADSLGLAERLDLVRLLAEGLRSAHSHGLYHRALSPRSIVVAGTPDRPRLKIRDWQTAARLHSATGTATTTTATNQQQTGTRHVGEHVSRDEHLYLAPEVLALPDADPRTADIFSLGALAILILTGQPPAADLAAKQAQLRDPGYLTLAAVADPGLAAILDETLIPFSTNAEPAMRLVTVAEFLDELSHAEEQLTAADTVDPLDAKPGDLLDDTWTVVKRFGAGSTAVVLLARTDDGRHEVLKVARDADAANRLRDEFEVASAVKDRRRIVTVHGLTEIAGRTVLRMEAAEQTLAAFLAKEGTPGLDLLQRWGTDLLEAVTALEDDGLAHRDIKPDNAGLTERGRNHEKHLILFDFSLSRANPEDLRAGTPGYVDPFLPERPTKRWDAQAERYAAAVTLHELATGTRPAWGDGTTDPSLLGEDVRTPTLATEVMDAAVRQPLAAFLSTALHRDADSRFDTAADMLAAWQRVFAALDAPATRTTDDDTATTRPGLPAAEVDLSAVTETTTIAELGLSPRVTSALDRQGVETVTDLAVIPPAELTRMSSVGATVRKEIVKLAKRLSAHLDAAASPSSALADHTVRGDESAQTARVDRVVEAILPSARTDADVQTVIRELLALSTQTPGEGHDTDRWPSQAVVAERTGLDRAAVAAALVSSRARWVKRVPELTAVRTALVEALDSRGGVASGNELAAALLTLRGSTADEPLRSVRARAVVRAALEAEQQLESPRMRFRRAGDGLLVALEQAGEGGEGVSADTRFAYAELLGEEADTIVAPLLEASAVEGETEKSGTGDLPPLPTREQAVTRLREIEVEEGTAALTDARLLRLAAEASATAALSSRLELYPRDLSTVDAVRLLRVSLQVRNGLTEQALRSRVATRFPDVPSLPERPKLDALLAAADAGLTWVVNDRGEGRYCPAGTNPSTMTSHRPSTSYASVEAKDAATEVFDQRIDRLVRQGGFVTVTVKDRSLDDAIRRLTTATGGTHVRLDAMLLATMRAMAQEKGAKWSAFENADNDPTSKGWRYLLRLAEDATARVEADLLATDGIVVADGIGLLGRYEQMGLVDRLRERLTREDGDHALRGLALVVPGADPTAKPVVDGVPVPVITPAHWTHLPTAWLDRTGAAA
ncbi:Tyrosine protein kinase:Serine/threonine protein kinase [Euzebya pacifica]|uniref:non-specific serine/threonine protein kinase n=1 Tax=Euzebya pacifica TaxID=1608957 RepID=A0A346XRY5_9ACTN|nr:Tyrosine protein kinase:Serine/threonine protein kinase [Euzebya pacifica]